MIFKTTDEIVQNLEVFRVQKVRTYDGIHKYPHRESRLESVIFNSQVDHQK